MNVWIDMEQSIPPLLLRMSFQSSISAVSGFGSEKSLRGRRSSKFHLLEFADSQLEWPDEDGVWDSGATRGIALLLSRGG